MLFGRPSSTLLQVRQRVEDRRVLVRQARDLGADVVGLVPDLEDVDGVELGLEEADPLDLGVEVFEVAVVLLRLSLLVQRNMTSGPRSPPRSRARAKLFMLAERGAARRLPGAGGAAGLRDGGAGLEAPSPSAA